MSRKVLGIDIRKESVSAVLVKTSLRENRVDAHVHVPISDSAEDENPFKIALETLCSEIDTAGCDCVVSISADHFSYRILQIPFKDSKKIKMVLPFELEATVPYPVDDLIIDFIDMQSTGHHDHTDIIAVAVPNSELTPYLGTLGAIKIDPELVTLSGLPAALCLAHQTDAGKDQLFLKVDKALSTLFIVNNGGIKQIRSFPTPATGDARAGSLGAFVLRTLSAFGELSQSEYQPPDMVVTGSGLNGANFDADVSRFLDLPVKRLNFADHLNIPIEGEHNKSWDPALMDNALALALMEIEGIKSLNFHKGRFAAKKIFAKYKKYIVKTGILADDTPPVGLAAYAAAAIAKSPPIATGLQGFMYDIRTAILPFMFIFNSDLILHNVNSWIQGLLIFAMACMGNFAFASATQGWFVAKNKFYEIPLFLFVTLNLMRPDLIARWVGLPHEQRYWTYLIGMALFGVLYLMQRPRTPKPAAAAAAV